MILEQVSSIQKSFVKKAFFFILAIANAFLTASFGATFGAEIIPTGIEWLSMAFGAVMLLVFFDIAAFAWFNIKKGAKSNQQRAISGGLAWASILASTSVSVTQLAFTTSLVDLSPARQTIGFVSLIILVALTTFHFIGLFAYNDADPDFQRADAESALKSAIASAEIEQTQQMFSLAIEKSKQVTEANANEIATKMGDQIAVKLARSMGYQGALQLSSGETVKPSQTIVNKNGDFVAVTGDDEIMPTPPHKFASDSPRVDTVILDSAGNAPRRATNNQIDLFIGHCLKYDTSPTVADFARTYPNRIVDQQTLDAVYIEQRNAIDNEVANKGNGVSKPDFLG